MRLRAVLAAAVAVLALAGCEAPPVAVTDPPPPVPEDPGPPEPEQPLEDLPRSEASLALSTYYARVQADLIGQDLLRGEGGGPDAPFTDVMLARNFVRIALFDEYRLGDDGIRSGTTESRLRRWEQPIRMDIRIGPTVPRAQGVRDRAAIATFAARLSRLTGVPIRQTDANPNFHVLVLTEDDRAGLEGELRAMVPGISDTTLRAMLAIPRQTFCLVVAFAEPGRSDYDRAVAIIRAEHPELLRTSCIHEELAQGMGLANDSPEARPSIFNDDNEYGRLTGHDELLLRMLYDDRLRPGMTVAEAAPIAARIAAELVPGPDT